MIVLDNVNIWGLLPEMKPVLALQQKFFDRVGKNFVVTSARDGIHSAGSYHYYGYAVDSRTRDLTEAQKQELVQFLKDNLSSHYDVILHDTHLHVEYDWYRANS